MPWAEERSRFTALFETWAIRLLHESTISGVAEWLGLSWDEVAHIQQRAVARGLARRTAEPVRVLGVDETSFQKRHEYVTVINDLEGDRCCGLATTGGRRRWLSSGTAGLSQSGDVCAPW